MSARRIAHFAVFAALIAALGYALSRVPNVELMTLGAFVAGSSLGSTAGAAVAAVAMSLYSGINPYGPALPPVFAAQVGGLAFVGFVGGVLREKSERLRTRRPAWVVVVVGALLGAALTLIYDVGTNLATAWAVGAWAERWTFLAGGIAFGAWHTVANAILFAVAGPPLLAAVRRGEGRLA